MKRTLAFLLILFSVSSFAQPVLNGIKRKPIISGTYVLEDSAKYLVKYDAAGNRIYPKIDSSSVGGLGQKLARLTNDVSIRTLYMSLSGVRAINFGSTLAPVVVNLTDRSKAGTFILDPFDTTTPDNVGTVLVTASGLRYKRHVIANMYDVAWYGTVGNGVADDTGPIQAAVNDALLSSNPAGGKTLPDYGIAGTVLVPTGTFRVSEIHVNGTIRILGQGGGTYAGSFFLQNTAGQNILLLGPDDDSPTTGSNSTVIENICFKSGVLGSTPGVAQIRVADGIASNSVYVRNCWFQTPETWAIYYPQGDDGQISGCTFDVTPSSTGGAILLGSTTGVVSNYAISNNTFFQTSGNDIKLVNVNSLAVYGNRPYTAGATAANRVFINGVGGTVKGLTVTANVPRNIPAFCLLSTTATSVAIVGNTGVDIPGTFLYLTGGTIAKGWTIVGNSFSSSGGWANYPITGDGCGMQNSVIIGNSFISTTTTANGINLTDSRVLNNTITNNQFSGFTTPYNITNKASNGITDPQTNVQGDSPISRTSYVTTLNADTPSGFFKYNGTSGMPADPSGFNEWLGVRIRNETSTATGGGAWIADLVVNEKTKAMYVGGNDVQVGRNSFDRIWTKSVLPFQENATHTALGVWVYNITNLQYEVTSPANLRSAVLGITGDIYTHNAAEFQTAITSSTNLAVNGLTTAADIVMGNTTNTSTSSPRKIDMGGTYSSTLYSNPKLNMANIAGTTLFSGGVSPNALWWNVPTGSSHYFGINSATRLTVGNTAVKSAVDVVVTTAGAGYVFTAPNGTCWRQTVDNSGAVTTVSITCP